MASFDTVDLLMEMYFKSLGILGAGAIMIAVIVRHIDMIILVHTPAWKI